MSGNTIYTAGNFTSVGDSVRSGLAAVDATTGLATDWNPNSDSIVSTIAVDGTTVYVGGYFNTIGEATRNYIAAIDATTGLATDWDPNADGSVQSLIVSGGQIYVGGEFTTIGGQPRNFIAALGPTTGAATSWDPKADPLTDGYGFVDAITVHGDTVYAGGLFAGMGGRAYNHLAALDAVSASVLYWYPNPDWTVRSIAVSNSGVYAGGEFTSVFGSPHYFLAGFSPSPVTGIETPVGTLPIPLRAAPNPFHARVVLQFVMPEKRDVQVGVYDLAGRVVRHLQDGELSAGEQRLVWDGRNDAGRDVSVGLYVLRVHAGPMDLKTKVFRLGD